MTFPNFPPLTTERVSLRDEGVQENCRGWKICRRGALAALRDAVRTSWGTSFDAILRFVVEFSSRRRRPVADFGSTASFSVVSIQALLPIRVSRMSVGDLGKVDRSEICFDVALALD